MLPPKKARLTVYLTPEQHTALKIEAATRSMTISDIVLEALLRRQWMIKKGENA